MVEHCFRCLSEAPGADAWQSADWIVLTTADGEYLGVVCVGCVADDGLALIELEELYEVAA
jgi:hypothetical protein